jgi:hypothetical protein
MPKQSILDRPYLLKAAQHFAAACAISRAHGLVTASALHVYGDHGPQISGTIRDHFPEDVRDNLRGLARLVTRHSDEAWAARPPRVRQSTMLALSRAVAQRDGGGFYGPRP